MSPGDQTRGLSSSASHFTYGCFQKATQAGPKGRSPFPSFVFRSNWYAEVQCLGTWRFHVSPHSTDICAHALAPKVKSPTYPRDSRRPRILPSPGNRGSLNRAAKSDIIYSDCPPLSFSEKAINYLKLKSRPANTFDTCKEDVLPMPLTGCCLSPHARLAQVFLRI